MRNAPFDDDRGTGARDREEAEVAVVNTGMAMAIVTDTEVIEVVDIGREKAGLPTIAEGEGNIENEAEAEVEVEAEPQIQTLIHPSDYLSS